MTSRSQTLPNGTIKRVDAVGRLHGDDGPAVEAMDGSFVWYRRGKIHRVNGPAVRLVMPGGKEEFQYWMNGIERPSE